jgi:hypothetical protein
MKRPVRLPDIATLEAVPASLAPASADAELIPALAAAFPALNLASPGSTMITGGIPAPL